MLTFPILEGRLCWGWLGRRRRAISWSDGWVVTGKKEGRGRNRGPRGYLKSAAESTVSCGR
jgi:hypothetical protein